MDEKRTLTDADVEALAAEFKKQFYTNLGIGVWSLIKKGLIAAAVALAYYGLTQTVGK